MSAPYYATLWHWIREREHVRELKDAGEPFPWTDDPIIRAWRFCNVRREDDRVTVWIRQNVRERYAGHPHLWFMLCLARMINWPDTMAELQARGCWPGDEAFTPQHLADALNERARRGDKVFTGAYIITAPATKGTLKTDHVALETLGALWRSRDAIRRRLFGPNRTASATLREAHATLMQHKGWGQFLAYQAVVDMRFTPLLATAGDRDRWAAAGPGTLRGLNRLYGRRTDCALGQEQALSEMRKIHAVSLGETGVPMDFSDVPNVLCETDKYLRVERGEGTPRAGYVPGRGS